MASLWNVTAVGSRQEIDAQEARRALAALADPDPACAVQLLAIPSGRRALHAGTDLDGLVRSAAGLADDRWVYVLPNPVPARLDRAARVADVVRRRWLHVDVDAVRPDTSVMATETEHNAALCLAAHVQQYLGDRGWPAPMMIDTGNGCALLYRIDLPNDLGTRALLGNCLRALALVFAHEAGAHVDPATFKSNQHVKLPGTLARKGASTPERPHRPVRLLSLPEPVTQVPLQCLLDLAAPVAKEAPPPESSPAPAGPAPTVFQLRATAPDGPHPYAQAALRRELGAVALARPGTRHNTVYKAAAAVGSLVVSGRLDPGEVERALLLAAAATGLPEAEAAQTVRDGLVAGRADPRACPEANGVNGHSQAPGKPGAWDAAREPAAVEIADVATIDDLVAAGSQVQWLWPDWIQVGVLTAIAAPGGTGKTRFCADLLRRIRHGLAWPDGQAIDAPVDSTALWVMADNHHDEIVTLSQAFGVKDGIYLNASKADPYGGVSLEMAEDLAALEGRVKAVRPALVVVDTVGNSTDRNLSKQEDAKAYYFPLQVIARRHRTAILCLTHLNATGHFLGRRVLEKVRVAIRMDQPSESDPKRRLEVIKSNSKRPGALGLTMGDAGNEYDTSPPERAGSDGDFGPQRGPVPAKVQEAAGWLRTWLGQGARKVGITRKAAEEAGIAPGTLYRAKDLLSVVEFVSEDRKWWRLADDEADF